MNSKEEMLANKCRQTKRSGRTGGLHQNAYLKSCQRQRWPITKTERDGQIMQPGDAVAVAVAVVGASLLSG